MEHQHFIPRSYLRNFAVIKHQKKKKKAFVAIYDMDQRKEITASVADVCVNSGLYTLQDNPNDPYVLEKYYAQHIDNEYPRVYQLLVSSNQKYITAEEKQTILNVILSLYFRTPKVLDALNRMTDSILDSSLSMTAGDVIRINFDGKDSIVFNRADADEIRRKMREENRISFLQTQFSHWREFVRFKEHATICVYKVEGDTDLITCDNPVTIRNSGANPFHLWDPDNIIQTNLDPRHYVFIMPNSVESDTPLMIHRQRRDKLFALTSIHDCFKSAAKWLIGKPQSIRQAVAAVEAFENGGLNSERDVEFIALRAQHSIELEKLMNNFGSFTPPVLKKLWEMKQMEAFQEDPSFQDILLKYAEHGFYV